MAAPALLAAALLARDGVVRGALADAWALIAPVDCAGCGAHDRALCPACATQLRPRPLLGVLDFGVLDVGVPGRSLPIVAGLSYDGVARQVLLALKEDGRTELARHLTAPLSVAVDEVWRRSAADALVPVPGSCSATARRGYQPVGLIARRAGLVTTPGLRTRRPALGHTTTAAAQKTLTLTERLAATVQAAAPRWHVSPRLRGRRVVLIDDVVTSGATLRAAALALHAAGAEIAGCAVIAATPRRVGESSIPWRFLGDKDESHGDKHP